MLALIGYPEKRIGSVLGENNYSSYEVQGNFALPEQGMPDVESGMSASFEMEFCTAASAEKALLSAIEQVYKDLRAAQPNDLTELRRCVSEACESIHRNVHCWVFFCHKKDKASYQTGHAHRSAILSMVIAVLMRLEKSDVCDIGLAAALCDVGKVLIPPTILDKEGALNSAEYAVIKVHPMESKKLLGSFTPANPAIIDIVFSHHEQVDGGGYPLGLRDEAIPLGSRIVSIADAFDAMTSERCYAAARSVREAMHILWSRRGKQFQTSILEVFLSSLGKFPPGTAIERKGNRYLVLGPHEASEPSSDQVKLYRLEEQKSDSAAWLERIEKISTAQLGNETCSMNHHEFEMHCATMTTHRV